jgi:hypothetical protein
LFFSRTLFIVSPRCDWSVSDREEEGQRICPKNSVENAEEIAGTALSGLLDHTVASDSVGVGPVHSEPDRNGL